MKPLPLADWDSSLQHVIDDMHGRPLNIHALMAHHPKLLSAWWDLRMYLVDGGDLEQRQCELVILRVAVHMKSWYEWASHVVRGIDSGLTPEEIEGVRTGLFNWRAADAVLLQAVDEVVTYNGIGEGTLQQLAAHFTSRQVMDVIALHGMYQTIGCLINTWGIELDGHVSARLPSGTADQTFHR